MKWLARLKKIEIPPEVEPTKPTKHSAELENRGFVGFVGSILAPVQKTGGDSLAANDPTIQVKSPPDDSSTAMAGSEIEIFTARLARFTAKGVIQDDAEQLADKLVMRDRESDDRRLCLECTHLAGYTGTWSCRNWQWSGVAIKARDAGLPGDLVFLPQRCKGFRA